MKAASPDRPSSNPDQEPINAWRAAAEAADHADIRAREEEEAFAKKHSRPTRILGWLVIGGIIMQVAGGFSRLGLDLGGPLFFIAGAMILKGSQAWVRFVAVAGSFVMLACIARLIWPLVLPEPVKVRSAWYSYGDLLLWTTFICPSVYFVAEAILAFVVLRHRQLICWTKTTKVFTLIVGAIFLIQASLVVARDLKNKELVRRFPVEIRKAEDYFKAHGTTLFAPTHPDAEELMSSPALHSVTLSTRSSGGIILPIKTSSVPRKQRRKATHWVKLPSGEWGKISIEFIVDEAP